MLSVIIPAYNEAERIGQSLSALEKDLEKRREPYEVVVVDDGSTDQTRKIVESFAESNNRIRLISSACNRGKGHAVRSGMKASSGEWIVFVDADYPTPILFAYEFIDHIQKTGTDIVFGSRRSAGAVIRKDMGMMRRLVGTCGVHVSRIILGHTIQDTQCGFKVFSKKAAQIIASKSMINRFGFDMEIVFLAKRHALRIDERPLIWTHDHVTTVRPVRDALYTLYELFCIAWRNVFRR